MEALRVSQEQPSAARTSILSGILQHIGASLLRYFSEEHDQHLRHLVSEGSFGREAMLGDLLAWQSAWEASRRAPTRTGTPPGCPISSGGRRNLAPHC